MPSEAGLGPSDLVQWTRVAPEAALGELCARLRAALRARRAALLMPSGHDGPPLVVASSGLAQTEVSAWLAGDPAPRQMELCCHGRTAGHLVVDGDAGAETGDAEALCAAAALLLAAFRPNPGVGHLLEPLGGHAASAVPPLLVDPGRFVLARDLPRDSVLVAAETRAVYRTTAAAAVVEPRAEDVFEALVALVPGLAVAVEGPDLRVLGASPLFAGQLGQDVWPGMRLQELLPELPADILEALRDAACGGEVPDRLARLAARTLSRETGGTWNVGFRPFFWPDGRPRGVVAFAVGSAPVGAPKGTSPVPDLFDVCPTPLMLIALPDLRVARHNAAMSAILGSAVGCDGSAEGLTIADCVAPSTWEQAGPALRQLLATGEPVHLGELRAAFADVLPEDRYFNWTLGLVRGPGGEPTHLLASAVETTTEVRHRRRQEGALLAAESLAGDLRRAMDVVAEPMALYRRPDQPEWHNDAFSRLKGEMPPVWRDAVAHALGGGTASLYGDDGRVRAVPLPGAGAPAALLTVTTRMPPETEAAAIRRTAALEAVLSSLTEGVLICDAAGDTLLVNPALCRMIGMPSLPRDRLERHACLYPRDLRGGPLPPENTAVALALAGCPVSTLRCVVRRADGQDRVIECSASVIADADGRTAGCAVVMRDVTRHQRLTEERDDFISVAAHELRTPLTALLLEVQLLTRTGQRSGVPDGWSPHFRRLYASAERMKRLVDGLLDVSRLERGAITIHPEPQDLGLLAQEEVSRLSELHSTHPITLRRGDVPPVRADRLRIEQVLANLVDNAVKYCPPGTPIEVVLGAEEGRVVLRVRDHGQGLPSSELTGLFTRYFRGEGHGPRRYTGLGLGLFISRQIAELHGGDISAANHPDGGLEVTLRLPLASGQS